MELFLRTTVPFFLLVALGYLSRYLGLIEKDGVKALSAYVYYFALPALLFINISELTLDLNLFFFLLACALPLAAIVLLYLALYGIFRFPKDILFLLIFCSILGNYAFLGIPFTIFAFNSPHAEYYASIAASVMAFLSIAAGLTILELHSVKDRPLSIVSTVAHVLKRLSVNPLIIAIALGVLVAVAGANVPAPIGKPIHMLGSSTSAVAIFMLGAFFYGRTYDRLKLGFALGLVRIVVMPSLAVLVLSFFALSKLEESIVVIMHGMPLAVASVVLAERYRFHVHVVTSVILVTTLASIAYLNIWLLLL